MPRSKAEIRSHALVANKTHVRPSAIWSKRNDINFFRLAALHPCRADRHTRNGKPHRIRLFTEKPLERHRGNVALEDITSDLRRMTGDQVSRHAKPPLHRVQIRS